MDSGQEWESFDETEDESELECAVSTRNRFKQRNDRQDGGQAFQVVNRSKKRKYKSGSSGSTTSVTAFVNMSTDDKLTCMFEQINKTYDKIDRIDSQQAVSHAEIRNINTNFGGLEERISRLEELCETQVRTSKLLSYKSIDTEARSMRNNLVVYGLTENIRKHTAQIIMGFLESELHIDTREMVIDRAHRLGHVNTNRRRDPKRPTVVRFRDYVDTERIMRNAYKLRGTAFGIDRQYPKEISQARSTLYKSDEAKHAKAQRQRVQIKYPAQLVINGTVVRDIFPDWQMVLNVDRLEKMDIDLHSIAREKRSNDRVYSHETIVDIGEEDDRNVEVHKSKQSDEEEEVNEVFSTENKDREIKHPDENKERELVQTQDSIHVTNNTKQDKSVHLPNVRNPSLQEKECTFNPEHAENRNPPKTINKSMGATKRKPLNHGTVGKPRGRGKSTVTRPKNNQLGNPKPVSNQQKHVVTDRRVDVDVHVQHVRENFTEHAQINVNT